MKEDIRPVNLDLLKFAFPITSIVSISHRVAGVVLFVGIALFLYALDASLQSNDSFEELKSLISTPLGKIIIWGLVSALAYHFVAGIKHYLLDLGVGETLEGAIFASRATLLLSAILIGLIAVWIFY